MLGYEVEAKFEKDTLKGDLMNLIGVSVSRLE